MQNQDAIIFEKIENLEKQIENLEQKIKECLNYIEFLKAENTRLQNDLKLLEEENKRLQTFYKDYINLQSKTEIAKQKLRKVIEKISQVI